MAKRSAQPERCAPPCKRFLLDPCCRPPYRKRFLLDPCCCPPTKKKMEPAEERGAEGARLLQRPRAASAPPPPRRADSNARRAHAVPGDGAPDPGGDGENRRRSSTEPRRRHQCGAQDQEGEECWQYNSFHYWRVPLPSIDFSEFLDLDLENITEEVAPNNSAEGADVEMES